MKKDGHIHSRYCPHGTNNSFEEYIEKAISLGFQEISFTEHAPLPKGFEDSTPTKDSAMEIECLPNYFADINKIKRKYEKYIKINAGLEVDYIEGFEKETTDFLNQFNSFIDDAILSVHFLKIGDEYDCVDYSPDLFKTMTKKYGSVEAVYENYFRTVALSVHSNLGHNKPKRIGHITLIHKFQHRFPVSKNFNQEIRSILLAIKKHHYELDYNGAGTAKPLCREPYPPAKIAEEAFKLGIPLIYGSDAHQVKELGQGRDKMHFF
ncbi:histidinol-phosphatase HisJ [Bacillus aquiflavi]|uniref:Histidinol-phosphatase n=1 Tax=Bacillus aquiflavi TaxID=2672567 RepID=A0A6B3W048_9BACI|nr:histidinol-phosphatase HisJ [Bacillus aquiflavi]MBA4537688.1 histidinol-phosphatase HisJ [Bacillus aquiflavi]NEY81945.1 histidinol-phosphatase HisJ [Bacillus aquiflavi]